MLFVKVAEQCAECCGVFGDVECELCWQWHIPVLHV